MYDLYPDQRAEGEVLLDGENILDRRRRTSTCCAPRSAWCSRSRRRSRCRSTTTSPSACGSTRRCRKSEMDERVEWALRKAALWDEVKDKLTPSGLGLSGGQQQRLCIARAVAVQAGGAAARRAVLGARPDLDRQDRGADRRAEGRLHDRHRHPQHAAGGARLRLHRLHVPGRADRVRRDRPDLHQPARAGAPRTTSPAASAESTATERNDHDRAHRPRPSTPTCRNSRA